MRRGELRCGLLAPGAKTKIGSRSSQRRANAPRKPEFLLLISITLSQTGPSTASRSIALRPIRRIAPSRCAWAPPREGLLREAEWVNDHYEDPEMWSLLHDEWQPQLDPSVLGRLDPNSIRLRAPGRRRASAERPARQCSVSCSRVLLGFDSEAGFTACAQPFVHLEDLTATYTFKHYLVLLMDWHGGKL